MSQSIAGANVLESETKEFAPPHSIYHADGSYNPLHSEANKKRLLASIADCEAGRNIIKKTMAELEAMEND